LGVVEDEEEETGGVLSGGALKKGGVGECQHGQEQDAQCVRPPVSNRPQLVTEIV
jgi:hypothetical protein